MLTETHPTGVQKLSAWLITNRWGLLGLAILWIIPAAILSRDLKLERSIESLYNINSPHLLNFQQSKQIFGADEFVIIAYEDPKLTVIKKEEDEEVEEGELEVYEELSEASFKRITEFSYQLQEISSVDGESIQNLAKATSPKEITFELFGKEKRITPPVSDEQIFELVEGVLIGKDHQTTAIAIRLLPQSESKISKAETIRQIRMKAKSFEIKHQLKTYIVGEPVQVHDMFQYVEEDGRWLFFLSLGLLAAVIFMLFRNIRWVLLPLFVVLLAVFTSETILVLLKVRLSMVSSILNSLVTIISIATVTHITVRYREYVQTKEPIDALSTTLTELLPAIFWTCTTTGMGFLVLMSSDITPVRSFGMMMALATLFVLGATIISIPGGALLGGKQSLLGIAPAENQLSVCLTLLNQAVENRPRLIGFSMMAVAMFSCGGFFLLDIETDFSKNFRRSSPIVQSLNFFEARLGGAGTWEVNFPAPENMTTDYLDKVRKLAIRLRTEVNQPEDVKLTKILCMTDGLDSIPHIPVISNKLKKKVAILNQVQPEFGEALFNPEANRMRIMLRSKERQTAGEKIKLIEQVQSISQDWANKELSAEYPDPKVHTTGIFVLLAYLIQNLLFDQLISFGLAVIGIVLMMILAFRHFKIGLISVLPNLFPIIVVVGGMGWVGLPINIATAMIASVSLGLTVDSSIHYLSEFQRVRSHLSLHDALEQTHQRVGRAMAFSNLALVVGFSVLTFSHFMPLVYFGILVSLAMLGGLAGNLVLLPLLLRWAVRIKKTEFHESE